MNLYKGKDVVGLKVITLDTGKDLGIVKDMVYDPLQQRVRALLLTDGGWFSEAEVLRTSNIQNIGKDAIMVNSSLDVEQASTIEEPFEEVVNNSQNLSKLKVITEQGDELGYINDVYFSFPDGGVLEYEVSGGVFDDMQSGKKRMSVDNVHTIGMDAIIVSADTKHLLQEQGSNQGIKKAKDTMVEKNDQYTEKTRQKFEEIKASPKTQKVVSESKDVARKIGIIAKAKVKEIKQKLNEESSKYENKVSL